MMSAALLALASCNDSVDDDLFLDVNEATLMFTKNGGSREVTITSNLQWEMVIGNPEWLTTASPLRGEGSQTITFTAAPYDKIDERTSLITITSAAGIKEIKVTQIAANPVAKVDKDDLSFKYAGGAETLNITSNTAWEIVIDDEDDWITTDVSSGMGDAEVVLTTPVYYGKADRNAVVRLRCEGAEDTKITISQKLPTTVGVWILSEGSAVQPTADLAYYDVVKDELKTKFYSELHGEPLGQVANFMGLYGSKMYVAISGPSNASDSKIQVIDSRSGALIKSIPMKSSHGEGDVSRQMAFHGGKVYVTSYFSGGKGEPGDPYSYYGGVVRIDTASLSIEAAVRVGDKPEGIAYNNGKLFVCNNETGNGTTMSVIDVDLFQVEKTITVPENPTYIKTADNGELYFSTLEIYTGANKGPSAFHKLDPVTYEVKTFAGAHASRFAITDRYIFTGDFSYTTYIDVANRIDRATGEVTPIDLDHAFFMIYSFDANPATGEIYLGGQGDDVIILNEEGEKLKSFKVKVPFVSQFVPILE